MKFPKSKSVNGHIMNRAVLVLNALRTKTARFMICPLTDLDLGNFIFRIYVRLSNFVDRFPIRAYYF